MSDLTESIKEFPFETYFIDQESERMEKESQRTVRQAITMRRRSNAMTFPPGTTIPLNSPFGGKRSRKNKKKRTTNKKCRLQKKRRRISKRQ
jgi:hypothetical protein